MNKQLKLNSANFSFVDSCKRDQMHSVLENSSTTYDSLHVLSLINYKCVNTVNARSHVVAEQESFCDKSESKYPVVKCATDECGRRSANAKEPTSLLSVILHLL